MNNSRPTQKDIKNKEKKILNFDEQEIALFNLQELWFLCFAVKQFWF